MVLPAGLYRVVTAGGGLSPVEELVLVADGDDGA